MSDLPERIKAIWGKRVRVFAGAIGLEDHVMAEGVVIGYAADPTILLQHDDGSQSHWQTSLPIKEVEVDPIRLHGDEESVHVMCNACPWSGGQPIIYYTNDARDTSYRDVPEVVKVYTFAALVQAVEQHRKGHGACGVANRDDGDVFTRHCTLAKGHEGEHSDGVDWWPQGD